MLKMRPSGLIVFLIYFSKHESEGSNLMTPDWISHGSYGQSDTSVALSSAALLEATTKHLFPKSFFVNTAKPPDIARY